MQFNKIMITVQWIPPSNICTIDPISTDRIHNRGHLEKELEREHQSEASETF